MIANFRVRFSEPISSRMKGNFWTVEMMIFLPEAFVECADRPCVQFQTRDSSHEEVSGFHQQRLSFLAQSLDVRSQTAANILFGGV